MENSDNNIYELQIIPDEICRACLKHKNIKCDIKLYSLYCSEIVDFSLITFPQIYETTTDIKISRNDGLPDKICFKCKLKINELYSFKQKCLKSEELLHTIFGKKLKNDKCINENNDKNINIKSSMKIEILSDIDEELMNDEELQIPEYLDNNFDESLLIEEENNRITNKATESPVQIHTLYCVVCSEMFTNSSDLRKHMNIHDSVKYECIVCDKKFHKATSRNKHIREKHPVEYKNLNQIHPHLMFENDEPEKEMKESSIKEHDVAEERNDLIEEIEVEVQNRNQLVEEEEELEEMFVDEILKDDFNDDDVEDDNNQLKCNDCNINFTNELLYFEHMKIHDKIEYICIDCNRPFATLEELEKHDIVHSKKFKKKRRSKISQTSVEKFHCQFCNVSIKTNEKINLHMEFHKKTFNFLLDSIECYRCGSCLKVFLTSSELHNHLEQIEKCVFEFSNGNCNINNNNSNYFDIEITENEYIEIDNVNYENKLITCFKNINNHYQCILCDNYEHLDYDKCIKHIVEIHLNNDNEEKKNMLNETAENVGEKIKIYKNGIHKCGVCNLLLPNTKETLLHIYFHSKLFQCPFYSCGNEYDCFYRLNTHLEKIHLNYNNPVCSHCDGQFENYKDLMVHVRNECNRRNLKCLFCDKKFLQRSCLMVHERIHTKEKRFMCQFCGKKFVQRGDLTTHNRIHTGEKPYKCNQCDKRFRTSGHRVDHLSTHTTNKDWICDICDKTFKAERILKSHRKLHTAKKNCQCPICGKLFSRKQHVKTHLQIHKKKLTQLNAYKLDENETTNLNISKQTLNVNE